MYKVERQVGDQWVGVSGNYKDKETALKVLALKQKVYSRSKCQLIKFEVVDLN